MRASCAVAEVTAFFPALHYFNIRQTGASQTDTQTDDQHLSPGRIGSNRASIPPGVSIIYPDSLDTNSQLGVVPRPPVILPPIPPRRLHQPDKPIWPIEQQQGQIVRILRLVKHLIETTIPS